MPRIDHLNILGLNIPASTVAHYCVIVQMHSNKIRQLKTLEKGSIWPQKGTATKQKYQFNRSLNLV